MSCVFVLIWLVCIVVLIIAWHLNVRILWKFCKILIELWNLLQQTFFSHSVIWKYIARLSFSVSRLGFVSDRWFSFNKLTIFIYPLEKQHYKANGIWIIARLVTASLFVFILFLKGVVFYTTFLINKLMNRKSLCWLVLQ